MPQPGPAEIADDASISGAVDLLRSFHPHFFVKTAAGEIRPDSRAFNEILDLKRSFVAKDAGSSDRQSLDDSGSGRRRRRRPSYEGIIGDHPDHLIVSIPARNYRDLGLGILPVVEPGPVGAAHCHVTGKLTPGKKNRLRDKLRDFGALSKSRDAGGGRAESRADHQRGDHGWIRPAEGGPDGMDAPPDPEFLSGFAGETPGFRPSVQRLVNATLG